MKKGFRKATNITLGTGIIRIACLWEGEYTQGGVILREEGGVIVNASNNFTLCLIRNEDLWYFSLAYFNHFITKDSKLDKKFEI